MSALYTSYKESLLGTSPNLATADVRGVLVDTGTYTFSAAHTNLSQITSGARIGTPVALTGKTITGGVFDAADPTYTGVSGASIEAVVLYVHNATETAATLIGFFDGLTLQPNGGNITIQWDNTASKIFAI